MTVTQIGDEKVMLTLLLELAAAAAATSPSGEFPNWMAGGWVMERSDGSWAEEWWTPAKAGVMLGAGRSGKGEELQWWEQTRIDRIDGKLRYCALPKGQAGACFMATKVTADEIVFENPAHDYPTRIAYQRIGSELAAETSGKDGAKRETWRYHRPK